MADELSDIVATLPEVGTVPYSPRPVLRLRPLRAVAMRFSDRVPRHMEHGISSWKCNLQAAGPL